MGFRALGLHCKVELSKCVTKYIAEQETRWSSTPTEAANHGKTRDCAVGINDNAWQCEVAPSFLKWKKELQHTEIMCLMKTFATWKLLTQ